MGSRRPVTIWISLSVNSGRAASSACQADAKAFRSVSCQCVSAIAASARAGRSIERRVRLLRPMERPALALAAMAETHWQETDRKAFASAWQAELAALPEFTDRLIHIVTGLLLPIWKRLPAESCRVY